MEYYIAITEKKQALLLPEHYQPESGIISTFQFDVPGIDELEQHFESKQIRKFIGTIIGYALREAKYISKNLRNGFYDMVEFLEGTSFIKGCLELGKRIRDEFFFKKALI